ncbi:MAG TPA: hypothetical protein VKE72_02125, partial [Methylocella sp.]|nr:hypothetical protein [Methylocella sp.]
FFSAAPRFNAMEGQHFSDPLSAERAARKLAGYGSLPRRFGGPISRKGSFLAAVGAALLACEAPPKRSIGKELPKRA